MYLYNILYIYDIWWNNKKLHRPGHLSFKKRSIYITDLFPNSILHYLTSSLVTPEHLWLGLHLKDIWSYLVGCSSYSGYPRVTSESKVKTFIILIMLNFLGAKRPPQNSLSVVLHFRPPSMSSLSTARYYT